MNISFKYIRRKIKVYQQKESYSVFSLQEFKKEEI